MSERQTLLEPIAPKDNSSFKEVGLRLKSAREAQNLSLEDIIDKTRINRSILAQIEEGRIEQHPGAVFLRGFLRTYATVVGLDPEEIVNASGLSQQEVDQEQKLYLNELSDIPPPRAKFSFVKLFIILLIVVGSAVACWYFFIYQGTTLSPQQKDVVKEQTIKEETMTEDVGKVTLPTTANDRQQPELKQEEKPQQEHSQSTQVEQANIVPVSKMLSLVIESRKIVWLRIKIDNQAPFETQMRPGEQLNIQAKEGLLVSIGDKSATRVFLNGDLITHQGKGNLVVDWKITADNE